VGTFLIGAHFVHSWVGSSEYEIMRLHAVVRYDSTWKILSENTKPYFTIMLGSHIIDRYHSSDIYFALQVGISYKI